MRCRIGVILATSLIASLFSVVSFAEPGDAAGFATPVFRSSSTNVTGANTSAIALNTPVGAMVDDLLIAIVQSSHGDGVLATISTPAGWIEKDSFRDQSPSLTIYYDAKVFYRYVTDSEPSSHTFTQDHSDYMAGVILAYADVNRSTPFEDATHRYETVSTTNHATNPVTVGGSNRRVVAALIDDYSSFSTPPSTEYQFRQQASVNGWAGIFTWDADKGAGSHSPVLNADTARNHAVAVLYVLLPVAIPDGSGIPKARSSASKDTPGGSGLGLSLAVDKPAGTSEGDLLIATIESGHSLNIATVISAPAGWTQKESIVDPDSSSYYTMRVYYRIATDSEPSSYTFTQTADQTLIGLIVAYDNVDPVNPFEASSKTVNGAYQSSHSTGPVTVVGSNRLLVAILVDDISISASAPVGYAPRGQATRLGWAGTFAFDALKGPGTYDETLVGITATVHAVALLYALKPEAASGNSVSLSSPVPSTTSAYTISRTAAPVTMIKCLRIEFDQQASGAAGRPVGMDISAATFDVTSTYVPTPASWTVNRDQANGVITLTNAGGETPVASPGTVVLNGIVNPSSASTHYLLMSTFNDAACSNSMVSQSGLAFVTNGTVAVNAQILASMSFTVAGRSTACNSQTPGAFSSVSSSTSVNFGRIGPGATVGGAQNLTTTTNAANGFVVYIRSAQSPVLRTSGGSSIADVAGTHAAPDNAPTAGTPGFGYTLSDAGIGFAANKFAKLTTANESVMTATGPSNKTECVGFEVAVGAATTAGLYQANIVYTAVPSF